MDALLLGPDEGDVISGGEKRSLVIKAERDELTLTYMRYVEGQKGPDPHVHREHCDCFYVIGGQLTFELGSGDVVRGDPGTLVLVPPNVVHTFRNEGPATARFLNVHAPSCGFHDHLRAMRDGVEEDEPFDQFDPPPGGGRPASDALVGAGRVSREGLSLAEVEVGGDVEERPPGPTSTSYWVLDGTLDVRVGDEELEAGPASYVLVPPGVAHGIAGPARVVTVAA